ncbi:uncharacterized protein G2W53_022405 [Senna tora]|uniref:Uncharacterized protein n=1 Tax=Senna tora TaxID=362788 RepID=A0A834TNL2_9FABA|nr:uncharacterized protein G2W53_022405 [Senna tora]
MEMTRRGVTTTEKKEGNQRNSRNAQTYNLRITYRQYLKP